VRFAVAQVEELRLRQFLGQQGAVVRIGMACARENASCSRDWLVTDINTRIRCSWWKGDAEIIGGFPITHRAERDFRPARRVWSAGRKQLIPYLTSLLKEMQAEGPAPDAKAAS